jgi:hypothetical protein
MQVPTVTLPPTLGVESGSGASLGVADASASGSAIDRARFDDATALEPGTPGPGSTGGTGAAEMPSFARNGVGVFDAIDAETGRVQGELRAIQGRVDRGELGAGGAMFSLLELQSRMNSLSYRAELYSGLLSQATGTARTITQSQE